MAKIKCEYCGEYIFDTDEICSNCGAINENHTRLVKDTPTTIEGLQSWYKARNLPPEETTRFFIGKNILEPRAFGIYKDNSGNFIVYKNKANGERSIRYKGTDEAYAVNELYLKLKSEILNQKSRNVANKSNGSSSNSSYSSHRSKAPDPGYESYKKYKRRNSIWKIALIWMVCSTILPVILLFSIFGFLHYFPSIRWGYYIDESHNLYYYDDELYDWWNYDASNKEWKIVLDLTEDGYLDGIDENNRIDYYSTTLTETLGFKWDDIDIDNSRAYIDAGHHEQPRSGHYVYEDNLYYYLNDDHADYGSKDNSGWYKYDHENCSWNYYGNYNDRELFDDDEMWYEPTQFYGGEEELYESYKDEYYWNPSSFTDTTWYQGYLDNETEYERYWDNHSSSNSNNDSYDNNWDNDSDYDWDDDYDWDAGDTDWDSDW